MCHHVDELVHDSHAKSTVDAAPNVFDHVFCGSTLVVLLAGRWNG